MNHLLGESHTDFMKALKHNIITTHLSDYDGVDERHWLPGEGIVRAISTVCHKRFGSTKVVFDCTLVAIAVARFVNFCNMHVTLVGYAVNLRIRADELRETKK